MGKAGVDPALHAAQQQATEQFGAAGSNSPTNNAAAMSPSDSHNNNNDHNDVDMVNAIAKHIRNKSDKLKDGMKSAFAKINNNNDNDDDILIDDGHDIDDEESGTVIVCSPSSNSSPNNKIKRAQTFHQTASLQMTTKSSSNSSKTASAKIPKMKKSQSVKSQKDDSLQLQDNNENDFDTIAPLQQSAAFTAPNLGKAKTMHSSSRILKSQKSGLQRSGSSKNILLRHLDKKAFT